MITSCNGMKLSEISMTETAIIVQARMGSTRFPLKMQRPLGQYTIFEWVLKRVSRIKNAQHFVLATSKQQSDDVLCRVAGDYNFSVYRGSENDVLGRFSNASRIHKCKNLVRVCADNPFIDPELIDELIDTFRNGHYDYAFNHLNRLENMMPDGFGAEIFTASLLSWLDEHVDDICHREHVTSYIWSNIDQFTVKTINAAENLRVPNLKFDIDFSTDLEKLTTLVNAGVSIMTPASEIVGIAKKLGLKE